MKLGDRLLPFGDDVDWLVGGPAAIDDPSADGVPLLVHLWSTGCPLCEEGAHVLAKWRDRFGAGGMRMVGAFVARPDGQSPERDAAAIYGRERMHIDYPCVYDRDGTLAQRFGVPYAPAYLVFDGERRLRHRQMGNGDLDAVEALIARLVKASPAPKS